MSPKAPSFSLRQLQYVVAVADGRSFRRAAERCHVAQTLLSAQIADLEATLGLRLFERDRRGVVQGAASGRPARCPEETDDDDAG